MLNSRIVRLLELLSETNGAFSVEKACAALAVSKRTLYYDLDKLDYLLKSNGMGSVRLQKGFLNLDVRKDEFEVLLNSLKGSTYAFSPPERKRLLTLCAGLVKEPVTLDFLCGFLDVSRNTVLSEIADLRSALGRRGLRLLSRGRAGYRIDGDEAAVRYCLMECFYEMDTPQLQECADDILYSAAAAFCGTSVKDEISVRIKESVIFAEKSAGGRFSHSSLQEISRYLLVVFVRAGMGAESAAPDEEIARTPEFQTAGLILKELDATGLYIPIKEQSYIAAVLLGSRLCDFKGGGRLIEERLLAFADDLVSGFESRALVRFPERERIIDHFLIHLRPLYYRLRYRIRVDNRYIDEIIREQPELFDMTSLTVRAIEKKYAFSVPADEVAYLCLYFGSFLRQNAPEPAEDRTWILIVCGSGVGASVLLRQQLLLLLGTGYRYEIRDVRQLETLDLQRYRLIVSTVPLVSSAEKTFMVSPVLSAAQKEKLLEWSLREAGRNDTVVRLLEIVGRYASITDRAGLIVALRRYLAGDGENGTLRLTDVFLPEYISFCGTKTQESEAIRRSCRALEKAGIVSGDYAGEIIRIIDELGLYAEYFPGILLAHAPPGGAVYGVGIGLTVFRVPVSFKKWGGSIRAVFTLATPDNEAHFTALRELFALLANEAVRQAVFDYRGDGESLYRLFSKSTGSPADAAEQEEGSIGKLG